MNRISVSRLDKYVLRQLMVALAATTGGLAMLIWLTQSLRFVSLVIDRGLSLRVFLELTRLLIPNFVAVILPITTFVVAQFVYQRLAGDRELTVMRAAGLAPSRIARPALYCTLIAVALSYVLNVWIVPASYHRFRQYEFEIRNKMAAFLLQEGVFTQVSPTMTVYIRTRDQDGTLHGIMVEDDRQKSVHATILAEHGHLEANGDVPKVVLFDGSRQEIDRKTGRLNVLTFQQNTIDLASTAKDDDVRFRDSTEMSLGELFHPDPRTVQARDRGKFLVEAHRRLTAPLTAFSFTMVALVAVLAGGFSRHGGIARPMGAILSVVGLLALGLVVQSIAARNADLIPLIWVQAILPGLGCAAFLFWPEIRDRDPERPEGGDRRRFPGGAAGAPPGPVAA
jgi:lipopolysaccharide export system permease protein